MLFHRRRHAFTLVELLVVIAIITILITVSLIVGQRVVSGGKGRATADTIRVLDAAMADYVNRVGHVPPPTARVETNANAGTTDNLYPVFDGRDLGTAEEPVINSVGLFLHQAEGTSGISEMIATINPRFVRAFDADGTGPQPELTTVFDGWDRPIRYVHPFFDGVWTDGARSPGSPGTYVNLSDADASPIKSQDDRDDLQITDVRRNFLTDEDRELDADLVGDSDGGLCPAPRPYFYSPGEDADPSTLDDNIYTTKPTQTHQG